MSCLETECCDCDWFEFSNIDHRGESCPECGGRLIVTFDEPEELEPEEEDDD